LHKRRIPWKTILKSTKSPLRKNFIRHNTNTGEKGIVNRLAERTGLPKPTVARYIDLLAALLEKDEKGQIVDSPQNAALLRQGADLFAQGLAQKMVIRIMEGVAEAPPFLVRRSAAGAAGKGEGEDSPAAFVQVGDGAPLLLPAPGETRFLQPLQPAMVEQLRPGVVEPLRESVQLTLSEPAAVSNRAAVNKRVTERVKSAMPLPIGVLLIFILLLAGIFFVLPEMARQVRHRDGGGAQEQVETIGDWQGGRYSGEKLGGMPHGQGTIVWPDGTVYRGQWKGGRMEGEGEISWPSGAGYRGSWRDGRKHGAGTIILPGGEALQGTWEHGRLQ
jgi:hypothetical protein